MRYIKITQIILSMFFLWHLSACQSPSTYSPELTSEEIRAEEIEQQKMVDEIRARGGLPKSWKNPKNMRRQFERVGTKIEKAGAKICKELNLQQNGCYYYFRMSRGEEINSHADGKNIVIYSGMMRFVENDDELAVVMAHEFVHNLMGHVSAQQNNATIGLVLGTVLDAVASYQGVPTFGEISRAGGDIGELSYGADFEREADYIGMYVMAAAGYDINKAPYFWRRMSVENPDGIYNSTTHPSNAERFVAMRKIIDEINHKRRKHLPLIPDFR
ncbi:MAG: M48 family metallopeptidase [Rickettsiales bacterium]